MDSIEPTNVDEWRSWLDSNHTTSREIWLVLTKGGNGSGRLTLQQAIDEALCFGWIDSRSKRLDEDRFMLRMTPRKDTTKWSQRNLQRAAALVERGRMTEAGRAKMPRDLGASIIASVTAHKSEEIPTELMTALDRDDEARNAFGKLSPGKRRAFIRWVSGAKRPDTRHRRSDRAVELLRTGTSLTEDMMGKWSQR